MNLALFFLRSALRAESDSLRRTGPSPPSHLTFLLPSAIELLPAFARAPTRSDALLERTFSFSFPLSTTRWRLRETTFTVTPGRGRGTGVPCEETSSVASIPGWTLQTNG